jgi:hypothetical protein
MNLDELRQECQVVMVGNYWVLFGDCLANAEHAMVIKMDSLNETCYYCCLDTSGRVVTAVKAKGRVAVTAIEAVCKYCHQAIEDLPRAATAADVLEACWRVRQKRVGLVYRGPGECVRNNADIRAARFASLIAQARERLADQSPAQPPPAQRSLDELLSEANRLLGEPS